MSNEMNIDGRPGVGMEAIAALRAVQGHHTTANGVQVGFLMQDATKVLGGLAQASNALTTLMLNGLIEPVLALVDGEVHTIYRVADATPPTSRSVH